jgi:alkylation response protein AidB-like acyl-CoA dehydrogenase
MTGQTGFNEVLFDNVVVPDKLRLDDVGKGWTVAMTTLLHERGAAEGAGGGGGQSLEDRIDALVALAKRTPRGGTAWDDPELRDKIMQIVVRAEGFRQTFRRARVRRSPTIPMRPSRSRASCSRAMATCTDPRSRSRLEIEGRVPRLL